MDRVSVESSSVSEVGFDPQSCTLEVMFKDGAVYQYFDVPLQIFESLMSADSVGRYVSKEIRGVYRYARV